MLVVKIIYIYISNQIILILEKTLRNQGSATKKYGDLTVFLGLFKGVCLFVVFVKILQVLKGKFLFFNQFQDFANSIQIIS